MSDKQIDGETYIFYTGPEFTDIDKYNFDKCIYPYFQHTMGADGYYYKCSTVATPTAKHLRLGEVTEDFNDFLESIKRNQSESFSCQNGCFKNGLRCNRMGLECNLAFKEIVKGNK